MLFNHMGKQFYYGNTVNECLWILTIFAALSSDFYVQFNCKTFQAWQNKSYYLDALAKGTVES